MPLRCDSWSRRKSSWQSDAAMLNRERRPARPPRASVPHPAAAFLVSGAASHSSGAGTSQEPFNERGNGVASRGEVAPRARIFRSPLHPPPPPPGGGGREERRYFALCESHPPKSYPSKVFVCRSGGKRRQREGVSKRQSEKRRSEGRCNTRRRAKERGDYRGMKGGRIYPFPYVVCVFYQGDRKSRRLDSPDLFWRARCSETRLTLIACLRSATQLQVFFLYANDAKANTAAC